MNIIEELNERGLIKDYSNEKDIREWLSTPQTIYCGFDPSAKSMHLGNFVMISILMRLQQAGHRIIAVVGGATGMIGDPSGKSSERKLLDAESTKANAEALLAQLSRFLDFSDSNKGILVNNYDWISKISIIDYLRDYGKYFSINTMLAKDIVASRLENGISFTEFSYMTMQSVDFLHLYRNYDCHFQIGGGDQWGNLTTALDFVKKVEGSDIKAGVFTAKLLLRSDGKKFGKSEKGALYLDRSMTSPYEIYQYFINTTDEDAVKYLKVFTFLSMDEINKISKEHFENPGRRIAQNVLAEEMVKIIHGEDAKNEAVMMSKALFSGEIQNLSLSQIEQILSGVPQLEVSEDCLLLEALVQVKAASSKREGREFIQNGSVLVNGNKITDLEYVLSIKNALHNKYSVIRRGKKNYFLIKHL